MSVHDPYAQYSTMRSLPHTPGTMGCFVLAAGEQVRPELDSVFATWSSRGVFVKGKVLARSDGPPTNMR